MENLVSRESYDLDETGYFKRLPIVMGLFGFLFGGLFFGLFFPGDNLIASEAPLNTEPGAGARR
jgi:hypothetical protein